MAVDDHDDGSLSAAGAFLATESTGIAGDGAHQGGWPRAQARCFGVARRSSGARWSEEGSVQQEVSLRPPVPVPPLALWCNLVLGYLFAKSVVWSSKSVALAIDGRICTPPDGVHLPMGVVIVDHMEIAMPASRHSLDEAFAEVVEGNGDLHVLVPCVGIAVAEQHNLVVVSHIIVGDGDGGGALDGVDEPVLAVGQ